VKDCASVGVSGLPLLRGVTYRLAAVVAVYAAQRRTGRRVVGGVHLKIVESDLRLRSHGKPRTLRCQNGARSSVAAGHTRPQSARGLPCDRSRRPVRPEPAGSGRFQPVPAASHYFEVHPGRKEGLVNGQAKVYRDSKSAN